MAGQVGTITVGAKLAGGTQQAFKAIADGMRTMASAMKALANDTRALGNSAQSKAYRAMATELNKYSTVIDQVISGTTEVTKQTKAMAAANEDSTRTAEKQNQALAEEAKRLADASKGMKKHEAEAEVLRLRYDELVKSGTKVGYTANAWIMLLRKGTIDMKVARQRVASYNTKFVESNKVQADFAKRLAETQIQFEKLTQSSGKFAVKAQKVRQEFDKGKLDVKEYSTALKTLVKEQAAAAQANAKAGIQADNLSHRYTALTQSTFKYATNAKKVIANVRAGDMSMKDATNTLRLWEREWKESSAALKTTTALKVKLQDLQMQYKTLTNSTLKYSKRAKDLFRYFKEGRISITQLEKKLATLSARQKTFTKSANDAAKALSRAKQSAHNLSLKYEKLIKSKTKYAITAKRVIALLKAQTMSARSAGIAMENLNRRQLDSMGPLTKAMNRLGLSVKRYMSYVVASAAVFAFINAAREATSTIIEYDQALKDLKAITRATDAELMRMDNTIRQVASDTKFSATEIAAGMKLIGQAGFTATEAIQTIDAVSDLATGTLTDMATTVDLMTTSLRVFNIDAVDSARVADVFANAVNRSKLTIDKIRTAMNYIGPVASAAGASLEETASAMMVLANQGIRASTIGTGLRQVFRRLVQPAEQMKVVMKEVGLTIDDFDLRSKSLAEVLENLKIVIKDNRAAFEMFGQRGATAALALKERGGQAILEMMDIVQRSGAAATMAAIQMEGLGVSFKNLEDKVKNLYLALGDSGFLGILRSFVDIARVVTDFLTGVFSNSLTGSITKILGLVAGVYAVGRAFKWLGAIIFGKNFFGPITKGLAAYKGVATGATLSTRLLAGAFVTLRQVSPLGWISLLIPAISLLANKFVYTKEKVEENVNALRVYRAEQQSNIDALKNAIVVLESESSTQKEKQAIMEKLNTLYPSLTAGISDNEDAVDELIPKLEKELELRQKLKDEAASNEASQLAKQLGSTLRDLADAKEKLDTGEFGLFGDRQKTEKEFIKLTDQARKFTDDLVGLFQGDLKSSMDILGLEALNYSLAAGGKEAVDHVKATLAKIEQAQAEHQKKVEDRRTAEGKLTNAAWAGLDADEIKEDYKEAQALLDKNLELQKIAVQRAINQRIMDEVAGQNKIQELEVNAASERVSIAQEAYDKFDYNNHIEEIGGALLTIEQMTEAHYKLLNTASGKHNTEIIKQTKARTEAERKHTLSIGDHETKLTQISDKENTTRVEHKKAMVDKVEDLERDLAQKISDINQKLSDKLKDLTQKRVDAEKKAQADILGIRQSFQEKLLSLEQRGMSDSEIELSNESFAREQYAEAQSALSAAIRGGDIDGIEQAVELFEKAGDYFGDLADTSKARSGIESVRDALIGARQEEEKISKAKIAQEEEAARSSAQVAKDKAKREMQDQLTDFTQAQDKKLAKALDTIQQQEQAEERRWQKELENYDAAIAKIDEKKQAALSAQQELNQYMAQSDFNNKLDKTADSIGIPSEGGMTTSLSQEGKKNLEKAHEEAAAKGIPKGIRNKEVSFAMEEVDSAGLGEKIAEDVGAGVQQGLSQVEQYTKVGDQSLEEWRKSGEKQGEAAGEAAGEEMVKGLNDAVIDYNDQGEPVSVSFEPSTSSVGEMMDDIQKIADDSPFEIAIDEDEAHRLLKTFVADAQRRYRITIPVTVTQANSEGGPVYKMASGGRLPGQSGPNDTLDVKARPGEWFIRNEAVASWQRKIGDWFMPGVNRPNSTPGKYLQSLLVHGTQANAVPEIPDMGKITIKMGGQQAQVMATPTNGKMLLNMLQDMEAFST